MKIKHWSRKRSHKRDGILLSQKKQDVSISSDSAYESSPYVPLMIFWDWKPVTCLFVTNFFSRYDSLGGWNASITVKAGQAYPPRFY